MLKALVVLLHSIGLICSGHRAVAHENPALRQQLRRVRLDRGSLLRSRRHRNLPHADGLTDAVLDGVGDVGLLLRVVVQVVRAGDPANLVVEVPLHPERIAHDGIGVGRRPPPQIMRPEILDVRLSGDKLLFWEVGGGRRTLANAHYCCFVISRSVVRIHSPAPKQ
jgi:hypothetical protein